MPHKLRQDCPCRIGQIITPETLSQNQRGAVALWHFADSDGRHGLLRDRMQLGSSLVKESTLLATFPYEQRSKPLCRELYLDLNWVAPKQKYTPFEHGSYYLTYYITWPCTCQWCNRSHALPRLRLVLQCDLRSEIGLRMTCYDSTNKRWLHGHVGTVGTSCDILPGSVNERFVGMWMMWMPDWDWTTAEGFSALNLKITFVHVLLGLGRTYPWHLFVGNPKIVGHPVNASFWKCLLQTRIRLESSGV